MSRETCHFWIRVLISVLQFQLATCQIYIVSIDIIKPLSTVLSSAVNKSRLHSGEKLLVIPIIEPVACYEAPLRLFIFLSHLVLPCNNITGKCIHYNWTKPSTTKSMRTEKSKLLSWQMRVLEINSKSRQIKICGCRKNFANCEIFILPTNIFSWLLAIQWQFFLDQSQDYVWPRAAVVAQR